MPQERFGSLSQVIDDVDRDWLLWAIECADLFGRRRVAHSAGEPQWSRRSRTATRDLPLHAAAVPIAREFAQRTVCEWGLDVLSENVGLVVSELVTNALLHAPAGPSPTPFVWPPQLSLAGAGSRVMCAVTDPSSDTPVRRAADAFDESGRGLHLVDYFSDGWGWLPRSTTGKVVWALFHPPS